jgi:peptide/nickel transport system ATP-binding protein
MADRIMVMYAGEVVEAGETEEVFTDPLHPYTKALLSAIPIPDEKTKREKIILQGEVPNLISPPRGCRFHPRCPHAFEVCGWSPKEAGEAFTSAITSGRYPALNNLPTVENAVETDETSFEVRVNGNIGDDELVEIRKAIESEISEGNRALKAVKEINKSNDGSTLIVKLHPFKVPKLALVKGEHTVSCHLYSEQVTQVALNK